MRGISRLRTSSLFPPIGKCLVYRDKNALTKAEELHVARVSVELEDLQITLRKAVTHENPTSFSLELVFERKGNLFAQLFLLIKEVDVYATDDEKLPDRNDSHYLISTFINPGELTKLITLLTTFSFQEGPFLPAIGKTGRFPLHLSKKIQKDALSFSLNYMGELISELESLMRAEVEKIKSQQEKLSMWKVVNSQPILPSRLLSEESEARGFRTLNCRR